MCGSGGHVYHENICYGRKCPVGRHVLQVCAEAATIKAAVSLGSWVFFLQFFFLQFFFFFSPFIFFPFIIIIFFDLRAAFQRFII